MNSKLEFNSLKKQTGATLLVLMLIVVTGASFMLVTQLNANINQNKRAKDTNMNLVLAKQALMAYAVTYPDNPDHSIDGPGFLPCPDRHSRTSVNVGYSGNSDAVPSGSCSLAGGTSIGRLPWKTMQIDGLRDSEGEYFWYAVSDAYRNNPKTYPLNSDTTGELTVNGQADIVAVIIAPGAALQGQTRTDANYNDIVHYLEGLNQSGGANITLFESGSSDELSNDLVMPVTREELMEVVEKRVMAELKDSLDTFRDPDDDNVMDYQFPWLSNFAPPAATNPFISGTAESGSNGLTLVDSTRDFVALGVVNNDLVQNTTDGTLAVVSNVSTNTLTLTAWQEGAYQFDIDDGESYQIPRFNGIEGTRQGHMPYHETGEAFLTGYTLDWTALESNSAIVAADTGVTHTHHQAGIESAVETSNKTTSSGVTLDFYSGSCVWSAVDSAECFGRMTDTQFISGTATSGTTNTSSQVTLKDSDKNFTRAGIKRGDLLANHSAMSTISTITGSATDGSGVNLLEDTDEDFVDSAIVPHYFVVEKDATGEVGIIQAVSETTLTLVSADENNQISFADTDDYTIRPIVQSIVTGVGNPDDTTIRGINIDGAASLDFSETDNYRVRLASKNMSSYATWPTPGGANPAYILYDYTADFSDVQVGDVFENTRFSAVGIVTAKGIRSDGVHWVSHTPLQGGSYDDIIRGEPYRIYHEYIDKRQYDINVKLTGVHSTVYSDNGKKVRDLCIDNDADKDCSGGTIEHNNSEPMVTIRDYNRFGAEVGSATVTIPSGGINGSVKLAGIHMDMIKDTDYPQWFTDNEWHHLVYLAYTEDLAPGYIAATNCITDAGINCLQIAGPGSTTGNIQSLVISAGSENNAQNRTTGLITDYFENDNSDLDEIFQEAIESTTFNDQLHVLQTAN
ncbi:MAG: hypothetical protein MI673_01490 [Thiotrichales bacterium]|nr:hypothetical protein [Thiotrichales bacterium]